MQTARKRFVSKGNTLHINQHQPQFEQQAGINRRKGLVRRLSFAFMIAIFGGYFIVSTLLSQASAIENKLSEKTSLEKQLVDLKNRQSILEEEIVKLNDEDYIGKIARRDYFFSEKDEVIFKLPDKTTSY